MAEKKVEFNLTEYGLGKVNVPVKDFWTYQVLRLDNKPLPNYLNLWGANRVLAEAVWPVNDVDIYHQVVLPQFEKKVCLRCRNGKVCNQRYASEGKSMEAGAGESLKDFEKRAKRGPCINPKKLEVRR
jgi:hypothetical protein